MAYQFFFFILFSFSSAGWGQVPIGLVKKVKDSTYIVRVKYQGLIVSEGAGFAISSDGQILTNSHVVEDALLTGHTLEIENSKGRIFSEAKIRLGPCFEKKSADLCLLKVLSQKTPYLKIPHEPAPQPGTSIWTLGHPSHLPFTLSTGILSALRRSVMSDLGTFSSSHSSEEKFDFIQITAPMSPGNSGGPVLDLEGKLLGVSTFVISNNDSQNLNFAISTTEIRKFLKSPQKMKSLRAVQAKYHAQKNQEADAYLKKLLRLTPREFEVVQGSSSSIAYSWSLPRFLAQDCREEKTDRGSFILCGSHENSLMLSQQLVHANAEEVLQAIKNIPIESNLDFNSSMRVNPTKKLAKHGFDFGSPLLQSKRSVFSCQSEIDSQNFVPGEGFFCKFSEVRDRVPNGRSVTVLRYFPKSSALILSRAWSKEDSHFKALDKLATSLAKTLTLQPSDKRLPPPNEIYKI